MGDRKVWPRSSLYRRIVCILVGGLFLLGCGGPIRQTQTSGSIDLLPLAAGLVPTQPANGQPMIYAFARGGVERQAITLQADSKVPLHPLIIPAHATLAFALAMPFNLGDGAMARVFLRCKEGEFLLMERRLDPARKREDRNWYEATIDMGAYAGKQGQIVLQASTDTGESTGDWIGWGDPRILLHK